MGTAVRSSRGDNAVGNEAHAVAWSAVRAQVAPCSVRLGVSNNNDLFHWQTSQDASRQTHAMTEDTFKDVELEQHPARNHVQLSQASASSASRRHDASPEAREHGRQVSRTSMAATTTGTVTGLTGDRAKSKGASSGRPDLLVSFFLLLVARDRVP